MSQTEKPPAHGHRSSQAGFTLIEALVAIVVLVFGLVAVTNLFVIASTSNTVANQSTAAASLAAQTLEELKAIPFAEAVPNPNRRIAPGGDLETPVAGYSRTDTLTGVGEILTTWEVRAVNGNPQIVFITVRSEGRGVLAAARSRAEFTTFRACTDPNLGCP